MTKKHFKKAEPEHRLKSLDNKPKDRGDHTARNVKTAKNKMSNAPQVKSETKNFFDCLKNQIEANDVSDYLVMVENEKNIGDRGDAEKVPQLERKKEDKKVTKSKYMMPQMNNPNGVRLSEKNLRKIHEKMTKVVEPLDIEKRRRLYKMYTFRKSSEDSNISSEDDCSKIGTPVRACHKRFSYPKNKDSHDPPVVHIRHETIEESEEECVPDEEDVSMPTSSTDHSVTEGVQTKENIITNVLVQTGSSRPPSGKSQSVQSSTKKQKMVLLKTRHASPVRYNRQPIVRTLMSREGGSTRIYKSVSFVEQKKKAPLKIQVGPKVTRTCRTSRAQHTPRTPRTSGTPSPSHSPKSKHNASSHTSTNTHVSLKLKHKTSLSNIQKLVMNRECKNRSRRLRYSSPEIAVVPPLETEVAKWVPQSVNEHTKPYYEAWVNTTLAAISSDNEKKRREKERIIRQMQERLQYQASLEMSEDDISDEKYTGRIKVIHR